MTGSGSDLLEEEELRLIERRWLAASPGPWFTYVANPAIASEGDLTGTREAALLQIVGGSAEDVAFIAHARDDIPRLIREVRTLRASLQVAGTPQERRNDASCGCAA